MLKFTAIGDFHYRKGSYPTTIEDLEKIIENSYEEKVDFILHLGDYCVDYKNSPEVLSTLLNNKYNIPVYGVMGNHELERDNHPYDIIPYLTNQEVVFGEPIYNEEKSAHWYVDFKNYRIIGTDTNFVYLPETNEWERKMTFYRPEGSILDLSLAPLQLEWLEEVIKEAAELGKKVIVASHAPFFNISTSASPSPDLEKVQEIFKKYPKTVVMSINGHDHLDDFDVIDNVAYFDVNACRFGYWWRQNEHHYLKEHTFLFTDYDKNGNKLDTREMSYQDLIMAKDSWFYKDPLWAIVSISEDFNVSVKGKKSEWAFGIAPNPKIVDLEVTDPMVFTPVISDYNVKLWD